MKIYHYLLVLISLTFLVSSCDSSSSTSAVNPDDPTIVDIAGNSQTLSTLSAALVDANLAGALSGSGPFTVFAPTNNAFDALPEGLLESLTIEQLGEILTYHVLDFEVGAASLQPQQSVPTINGGELFIEASATSVTINGSSSVTGADVLASNGIIHIIDTVLLPDAFGNVVENAQKRYFLSSLVDAVIAADLADALSDPDTEFTVFAPTNEAFNAIEDVVAGLSIEELTEVLLYHVVDSRALSGNLQDGQTITTLGGQDLTVGIANGVVTINGSAVVTSADNDGANGVIHIIDAVLIPSFE
ncbi:MAG: fasciclin domain-containing protein [Balneolia bacterium]|nr:fasciclin domain-containing protein [Balneolia bacterium]